MQTNFNTPVLFLIFNRPNLTQQVFDKIKKVKPTELFVVADGARNQKEWEICNKTRKIIDQIDWPCTVNKNYSDKNLGCKIRVSSGINWFFENVEQGIILEDDCLPSTSFFYFCQELLEKYRDNEKIMCISGDNFQDKIIRGDGDYFFSIFNHIWGWATWKRAWNFYDINIKNLPKFKRENKIKKIFPRNKLAQKYWLRIFDKMYKNKEDTWDYQWVFTCWNNNGLTCLPNKNLISNIGAGSSNATHGDKVNNRKHNLETYELDFPLKHPSEIKIDTDADNYTLKNHFGVTKQKLKEKRRKRISYIIKSKILKLLKI